MKLELKRIKSFNFIKYPEVKHKLTMNQNSKTNNTEVPTSLKMICNLVRALRLAVDPHMRDRYSLRSMLCYFQNIALILFFAGHFGSTVMRSRHNLSYFIESLLYDILFLLSIISIQLFYHHFEDLVDLSDFMEKHFTNVDPGVTAKFKKRSDLYFRVLAFMISSIIGLKIFEKCQPFSQEQTELRRRLYHLRNPSRQLFLDVYIPFMDETESILYIALTLYGAYITFLSCGSVVINLSLLPSIVSHLTGQYEILISLVKKFGHNPVILENVPNTNDVRRFEKYIEPNHWTDIKKHKTRIQKEKLDNYHKQYLKELVQFNQMLSQFQSKVMKTISRYSF